jgi:hypothetical protein
MDRSRIRKKMQIIEYQKPEVVSIGNALEAITSPTLKGLYLPFENSYELMSSPAAYEADE